MSWLDKLVSRGSIQPMPTVAADTAPAAMQDDRIHHEYFVDDDLGDGGLWGWLCRVYATDGAVHLMIGNEESSERAKAAALAWADSKKRELRRKA